VTNPAHELSAQDTARRAATGEVLLLDVREAAEWAAGHVEGAVHLPLGSLDPSTVPTDRLVVVVCRSGNRSGRAALALAAAGTNAANMVGGMNAWATAGLPIVRDDGSSGCVA
jgi:rhodanese-related sulfurtransferase